MSTQTFDYHTHDHAGARWLAERTLGDHQLLYART